MDDVPFGDQLADGFFLLSMANPDDPQSEDYEGPLDLERAEQSVVEPWDYRRGWVKVELPKEWG